MLNDKIFREILDLLQNNKREKYSQIVSLISQRYGLSTKQIRRGLRKILGSQYKPPIDLMQQGNNLGLSDRQYKLLQHLIGLDPDRTGILVSNIKEIYANSGFTAHTYRKHLLPLKEKGIVREMTRAEILQGRKDKKESYGLIINYDLLEEQKEIKSNNNSIEEIIIKIGERKSEINIDQYIERILELNKMLIKKYEQDWHIPITIETKKPIAISFTSDWHLDIKSCDLNRLKEDIDLIANTDGIFAVAGGDLLNNAIKHQSMILESAQSPEDELQLLQYFLEQYKGKLIALCCGNHEDWTKVAAGVDVLRILARENKIAYSENFFLLDLIIGKIKYKCLVAHRYSRGNSCLMPIHVCQTIHRESPLAADVDIISVGHHHEPAIGTFIRQGRKIWGCRTGSYQIYSKYARMKGFIPGEPSCPTFIFDPNKKMIIGFADLREAISALSGLRQQV